MASQSRRARQSDICRQHLTLFQSGDLLAWCGSIKGLRIGNPEGISLEGRQMLRFLRSAWPKSKSGTFKLAAGGGSHDVSVDDLWDNANDKEKRLMAGVREGRPRRSA